MRMNRCSLLGIAARAMEVVYCLSVLKYDSFVGNHWSLYETIIRNRFAFRPDLEDSRQRRNNREPIPKSFYQITTRRMTIQAATPYNA